MVFYRKKPKAPVRRRPRKTAVPKSLAMAVKSQIQRSQETKVVSSQLAYTSFNSGINATGELYRLLPAIGQGSAGNQRIGDKIKPVRLVIKGYVNYRTESFANSENLIARLFAFQDKQVRCFTNVASTSLNLLDPGASPKQFTGNLLNVVEPHNGDQFTFFYDKKHNFYKGHGQDNLTISGSTTNIISANASTCWFFQFTIPASKMPKSLVFEEGSTNVINFNPLIALGYAYNMNDSPDTASTQLGLTFTSALYYKDA